MEYNSSENYYGGVQLELPNSTAVLVLGIISIVSCFCYGIIGLILGVIALILASKDRQKYLLEPEAYTQSSYKNLMTGRTIAIIGVSLSAMFILVIIIAIFASVIEHMPWEGLT